MVYKRYTEGQMIAVLRERETLAKVTDRFSRYGTTDAVYYNWKARYVGLTVGRLKKLKALEEATRHLKQIVAEKVLDIRELKHLLSKTFA